MRSFQKISLFIVVLLLAFLSCRKSFETDWDVDVEAPIATSKLNIKNFFSDTLFQSDPTGLLHLAFSKRIAGFALNSLVHLPDTILNYPFAMPPNSKLFLPPGNSIPSFPQQQEINFAINNGVELRTAIINKGQLKMVYSNSYTQPLVFYLTLPYTTIYGIPFQIAETVYPGVNNSVKYYDISGYTVKLNGLSGNKINTLVQNIDVQVASFAQPDTIRGGQGVYAQISYKDLVPYYVEGYFGQQNINLAYDSVSLNLSNNLQASNFQLPSAFINFRIVNGFGVDINAQLSNIKSINTYSNTSVNLNAGSLSNININKAGKTTNFSSPVFPSVKTVSVNYTNSNLKPFLENLPDYLTYQGNIVVNPLGNVSGSNDFVFLNTSIDIFAEVDMPLQVRANFFKLITTSTIDLTKVNQIDNINHGNLFLQATNGFPFNAVLQGYILNEQKQIIDSLFSVPGNTITRGTLDASYVVTSSVYTKLTIPLTESKLKNIKLCRYIKFESRFDLPVPQPPDIKILDSYDLNLILSVDINYKARKK
ncbi:MAG TPA: hypothetical protein VN026_14940 [Bacteroidia bacterium]|jgi:hypothetical protein|nr:hypothetical protein [Bacteroidia bacterium]